ncbi:PrGVORF84 [Pieris rapae granulovirus Wuhan]|uniref:PrGVORF84 n=1 Tax=Pieris rapae granulovirus Wuhan TaxID=2848030 RepID=D2J4Q1_9BBAC|nr:PrGVORF84 [Betabaculovirus arrapae]ACZ63570.1 PrGVORF84 [Betabaculovirus arrapae]ADO85513.1 unknown [Pieris rapae granulovirus]
MNNQSKLKIDNLYLKPDGAHRHVEIEKTQHEIIQQHKYLETQINQLKQNINNICSMSGMNCYDTTEYNGNRNYRTNSCSPVANDALSSKMYRFNQKL